MTARNSSMRQHYLHVRDWVRGHPGARGIARAAIRLVPDIPVTMNVPDIGRFRFGLRRHRWLLGPDPLGGGHRSTLAMFRRLIHPGDVFYDVGANIGYYFRWVLGHLPVGHAVALEPMSANIRLLRANLVLSGVTERCTMLPLALGHIDGEELLQVDDMADGSAVLNSVSGGQPATGRLALGLSSKVEPVMVRRLDALIAERGLPLPDVIKIDAEGAEGAVLRGAIQTLSSRSLRLLIATHGPERAREVLEILAGAGYVCFGRLEGGRWAKLDQSSADALADNNLACSRFEADIENPPELDAGSLTSGAG